MNKLKKKLICFCISLIVIINFDVSFAQQAKVVSSYGPINQDVGFNQIKADRMKVKSDRAKEHMAFGILINRNSKEFINVIANHRFWEREKAGNVLA